MSDILERLRSQAADAVDWHGKTMKEWDSIRHHCETLPGSDLPRLMFEGLVESLSELMVEGADEINRLRSRLEQAEADRESYKDQMIRAQLALHDTKRDTLPLGERQ